MKVWRICAERYRDSAFSGVGGLYVSGRWHLQGHKIVYTAENLSLASLEVFVHLESDRVKLVAIAAYLPDEIEIESIEISSLPNNWQDPIMYSELQQLGQQWLKSRRTPVLKVPSAIVPVEFNYLFNPEHPDFQVNTEPPMQLKFDRRMWKK